MYLNIEDRFENVCDKSVFSGNWLLIDIETDGFNVENDSIILIRFAYMKKYRILSNKKIFIQLNHPVRSEIKKLVGLSDYDFDQAMSIEEVLDEIVKKSDGMPVVTTNFSYYFLKNAFVRNGYDFKSGYVLIDRLKDDVYGDIKEKRIDRLVKMLPDPVPDVPHINDVQMDNLYRFTVSVFKEKERKNEG